MPTEGDIADFERQPFFRRTVLKRNLFLLAAILLDVLVLTFVMALHVRTQPISGSVPILGYHVYFAFETWPVYTGWFVLLLAQIGLALWAFYKSLDGPGMVQIYPEDKSGERRFGVLTGKELADMVHDMAQRMQAGRIRRIVVNDRPDPNAYTAHIIGLGNIVVLHSNLLEIMPPEGVCAVVAHEVGHIRRRDSLVFMLASIPKSFLVLLGLMIFLKMGIGIFASSENFFPRILFVLIIVVAALAVLSWLIRIANLAAQQAEHLADAYAAHLCGWQPTMNALMLLSERAEAVHAVLKTLQQQPHLKGVAFTEDHLVRILKRLPPRELDDEKARLLAPRLYIEERLAELRDTLCVPLSDAEIVELARRAEQELRQKQAQQSKEKADAAAKVEQEMKAREAELEKLLIDWRKFDWDRSGHLDPAEAAALVAELRADSRKMIFRQFLEPNAEWQRHPTMRRRLLYLYDAFAEQTLRPP